MTLHDYLEKEIGKKPTTPEILQSFVFMVMQGRLPRLRDIRRLVPEEQRNRMRRTTGPRVGI